jgi:hypothetical protein
MGKVQRVRDRLADIGIRIAGQAPEPGLYGIQRLADGDEPMSGENALDGKQMLVDANRVVIGKKDRYGPTAEGDVIGAKFLQLGIGIRGLVLTVPFLSLTSPLRVMRSTSQKLPLTNSRPPASRHFSFTRARSPRANSRVLDR